MGLLKLLNTGKSLVGLTDKLVTKVPLGEVVPNFNTRPGVMSRAASAVRGRKREVFAGESRPAARAGGPNIRSTVAQRRRVNRKFVESMVQILSEFAFIHHFLQIAVGRRNHSYIHLAAARRSERTNFLFLQRWRWRSCS